MFDQSSVLESIRTNGEARLQSWKLVFVSSHSPHIAQSFPSHELLQHKCLITTQSCVRFVSLEKEQQKDQYPFQPTSETAAPYIK
jgi:hypothetical protein